MPEQQQEVGAVVTPQDGVKYWAELAKSFGLPFAMCTAMMAGFWFIMQQQREDYKTEKTSTDAAHSKEVESFRVEQKADREKLIELTVQGNTALDKVGDATIDVSKGLGELKDQGEKIEEALNKLSDAVNDRENP